MCRLGVYSQQSEDTRSPFTNLSSEDVEWTSAATTTIIPRREQAKSDTKLSLRNQGSNYQSRMGFCPYYWAFKSTISEAGNHSLSRGQV